MLDRSYACMPCHAPTRPADMPGCFPDLLVLSLPLPFPCLLDRQVEKTSSAAQEESSFLAEHMQSLLDERTALREALEKAQREKAHLARENELLRQELLGGWDEWGCVRVCRGIGAYGSLMGGWDGGWVVDQVGVHASGWAG